MASFSISALLPHDHPTSHDFLRSFYTLSYRAPRPSYKDGFQNWSYYGMGPLDFCFIFSAIVVCHLAREVVRHLIYVPFANKWLFGSIYGPPAPSKKYTNGHSANGASHHKPNGVAKAPPAKAAALSAKEFITRKHNVTRFGEQGWQFTYALTAWTFGLVLHCNLPTYPFDLEYLWIDVPHSPLVGPIKFYYLFQTGFWLHQVFLLNIEARRKDHFQMMTHHFITLGLLYESYIHGLTRVGILILLLTDFCDILLPLAKMFGYLELPLCRDTTFVAFLLGWIVTRHIGYPLVNWSAFTRYPLYRPEVDSVTDTLYWAFNIFLFTLEILMIIWFVSIARVTWKVVSGSGAEDVRSDGEDEDEPDVKKSQ